MADLSDGFVALPGGTGTLDELFEVYTWTQLGLHAKPLGLLDVRGYYASLVAFLDHAVAERFVTAEHREMLVVGRRPGGAAGRVQALARAGAREVDRSRADLSSASIAVAAAERRGRQRDVERARERRLQPPQLDDVAGRRRRELGDQRDADAGDDQPADRAVVVGGEGDPRRRSRPSRAPWSSIRLQVRSVLETHVSRASSRHRRRRRAPRPGGPAGARRASRRRRGRGARGRPGRAPRSKS